MENLNKDFWEQRYKERNMGWDIGYPSTPLREYIDHLNEKNIKMLVPGAGNAYEVEYLYEKGFSEVYILDWSELAMRNFRDRVPDFPADHMIMMDFFEHTGQYDLILEQTFFSALDPALRDDYARHMHDLLRPDGRLAGVLFDDPLFEDHPPFGGNKKEYLPHFEPYFKILTFETCRNSIPERAGRELFMVLEKGEG